MTLNKNGRGQHRKYLPYVFTEQGIAMPSRLLRNEIAIQVSINIIDAFVEMRKFISSNGQVFKRLTNVESRLLNQDKILSNHEKNLKKYSMNYKRIMKNNLNKKYFLMDKFMMHIV